MGLEHFDARVQAGATCEVYDFVEGRRTDTSSMSFERFSGSIPQERNTTNV